MKKAILCITLLAVLSIADARTWTDTKGRTVNAEVVLVNPNKTVQLKIKGGRTVTVPFATFSTKDIQYLDNLLAHPDNLHPVPWKQMNKLIGIPLWNDWNLWDDPCSEVASRMGLHKESETDFMENYRGYPLGKAKMFGEPVYAVALYGSKTDTASLSLVFLNQGDLPSDWSSRNMKEQIEACGTRIESAIEQLLGKPERTSLGQDVLREKVWRWNWNGHAILLSQQEGKYSAVRIMPTGRADHSGRIGTLSDDQLRKRVASCVERRKNGDVIIRNIPMIDQGPKGYCMPATWERYLRYVDIPADMYLLALAANTGVGGGTYTDEMLNATKNIIGSNGRKLESCGSQLDLKTVAKQIDKGLPIMWTLLSTPAFQRAATDNTARRNGKEIKNSGQSEDTTPGGHICLIIGYNMKTDEIAISDSWGPRFAERWVSVMQAQAVSEGDLYVIKW